MTNREKASEILDQTDELCGKIQMATEIIFESDEISDGQVKDLLGLMEKLIIARNYIYGERT